ncbi:hypothetical protein K438DRAFT_1978428 [Mycena galopus ATCC 62051]|nr:hypothetical protein K438DRAFT_1978428 [Mycena galopus ATCC 62051]
MPRQALLHTPPSSAFLGARFPSEMLTPPFLSSAQNEEPCFIFGEDPYIALGCGLGLAGPSSRLEHGLLLTSLPYDGIPSPAPRDLQDGLSMTGRVCSRHTNPHLPTFEGEGAVPLQPHPLWRPQDVGAAPSIAFLQALSPTERKHDEEASALYLGRRIIFAVVATPLKLLVHSRRIHPSPSQDRYRGSAAEIGLSVAVRCPCAMDAEQKQGVSPTCPRILTAKRGAVLEADEGAADREMEARNTCASHYPYGAMVYSSSARRLHPPQCVHGPFSEYDALLKLSSSLARKSSFLPKQDFGREWERPGTEKGLVRLRCSLSSLDAMPPARWRWLRLISFSHPSSCGLTVISRSRKKAHDIHFGRRTLLQGGTALGNGGLPYIIAELRGRPHFSMDPSIPLPSPTSASANVDLAFPPFSSTTCGVRPQFVLGAPSLLGIRRDLRSSVCPRALASSNNVPALGLLDEMAYRNKTPDSRHLRQYHQYIRRIGLAFLHPLIPTGTGARASSATELTAGLACLGHFAAVAYTTYTGLMKAPSFLYSCRHARLCRSLYPLPITRRPDRVVTPALATTPLNFGRLTNTLDDLNSAFPHARTFSTGLRRVRCPSSQSRPDTRRSVCAPSGSATLHVVDVARCCVSKDDTIATPPRLHSRGLGVTLTIAKAGDIPHRRRHSTDAFLPLLGRIDSRQEERPRPARVDPTPRIFYNPALEFALRCHSATLIRIPRQTAVPRPIPGESIARHFVMVPSPTFRSAQPERTSAAPGLRALREYGACTSGGLPFAHQMVPLYRDTGIRRRQTDIAPISMAWCF